jgi:hypothetical protein
MFYIPNPMHRIIRATAKPAIGRPIYGARLNHEPVLTSPVQQLITGPAQQFLTGQAQQFLGHGVAFARTKNTWYIVLEPATSPVAGGR